MVGGRWLGAALLVVVTGCPTDAATTGSGGDTSLETYGDEVAGEPDTGVSDDPSAPPSTTEDGGATETGDVMHCPDTHACIAPAPESWLGPVALVVGGVDACPDAYPQLELDAFTQISATPPVCSCECDATPLCGGLVASDLESACVFPTPILDATQFTEPDVCTPIPAIEGQGLHLAFEPDAMAECLPTASAVMPDPLPSDRLLACGATVVETGCPGLEICVPRLDDEQLKAPCVLRTGAHECPTDYPVAQNAFTSVLDGRTCSPCGCTAPDGAAGCNTTLRLSSVDDCSDQVVPDTDVGAFTCIETAGLTLTHLSFAAVDTYVSGCEPSGGIPMGTAEPADPVTICCAG